VPFLSISFTDFRNVQNETLDLLAREVYFIGDNGQGKSNLLESMYLVSYGGSFRTRDDSELVRNGQQAYSVRALYKNQAERTSTVSVVYKEKKKRIEKNAKVILDRKELIDTIPCILYNHDDLDFASGSPERKRFFIDQSLSMYDSSYIDVLRKYKKILKTRNQVLKDKRADILESIDIQLVEIGLEVCKRRKKTIIDFNRVFSALYEEVSGLRDVHIQYGPSWKTDTVEQVLGEVFARRALDMSFGMTSSGPHRDRIRFMKGSIGFIPTASTGQRRLISLLLRTAQASYYTEVSGKLPVLLMDDVLLELDPEKRQRFTALLPEYDQLFCTFLPGEPFERYKKTTTKVYDVSEGGWNERIH